LGEKENVIDWQEKNENVNDWPENENEKKNVIDWPEQWRPTCVM
jgi:hypothetical protein